MINRLFAAILAILVLPSVVWASPVETVVLADFEGSNPTVAKVTGANSSAGADSFSSFSFAAESGSTRLKMEDSGGLRNGIVATIPGAFTEPGFYLITSDIKVASTAAGPISTFGMAAKVGSPSTSKVVDPNAGYVLNLTDNPTNGAALGYQTIGAGIEVPAGGTFPKDLTLYFSTDPSGAPSDSHGDFVGSHRGGANSWPTAANTSAVYIDNIKRIGPGNFGEERHLWISIGDGFTNLSTLENYIQQGFANGFNAIDVLVRYRANRYFNNNRDFNTYPNNEPYAGGANDNNDPVQYAIDRGHELGMRVYGSFSTFLVTDGSNNYPSVMPSGSVTYVYNGGNPTPQTTAHDGSGLWADPGRADVRQHTLNAALDLAQNYDLDGIIFDRIRYQGHEFGYNPVALQEMGYSPGSPPSPTDPQFIEKRQQVITTFLHDAYVAITNEKPWMIVGTVPIAYAISMNDTYNRVFQDWPMWSATPTANRAVTFGAQDLIQPQFYRQWNSGGTNGIYNAPESNRILMTKAIYGDLASEPLDYGLMPGANTNYAPLFATLTLTDTTDAANTANALAANICDTQTPSYFANGFGIFSADEVLNPKQGASIISRIRSATTDCGPDVMDPPTPLPDFLMKEGWDNTPPNPVSGVTLSNSQQYYVNITWDTPPPALDGEIPSRYLIYRSTSSQVKPYYANQVGTAQTITGNSFTDGPFPTSGNYYYRIVPVDDYNNKGPSSVAGPVAVTSADVIVESRQSNGAVTASPTYVETGTFANTTSKSAAPGLVGSGARFSTNLNVIATFRPDIPVSGGYNVYATIGGIASSNNNALVEYTIIGSASPVTGQYRFIFNDPAVADNWLLIGSDVQFSAGTAGTVALKNLDGDGTGPMAGNRFVSDAVRFELVSSGVDDWQLY